MFQLKEAVGVDTIREREEAFLARAIARWSANPAIEILGNPDAERLSIVSFVVRHGERYLHHNYVVALLNDLFGVQSRGGCSCAGPYGHRLLGIDLDRSHEFEREITRGCEGIKPGWVRVNFNYFIDDETFDYIVDAVDLTATHGSKLLPHYRFEPDTGLWRHRDRHVDPPMSLFDVSYEHGVLEFPERRLRAPVSSLGEYREAALGLFDAASDIVIEPIGLPIPRSTSSTCDGSRTPTRSSPTPVRADRPPAAIVHLCLTPRWDGPSELIRTVHSCPRSRASAACSSTVPTAMASVTSAGRCASPVR